jgi:hypothetical protein
VYLRAGGMAQVIEFLPSKYESFSSNSSTSSHTPPKNRKGNYIFGVYPNPPIKNLGQLEEIFVYIKWFSSAEVI